MTKELIAANDNVPLRLASAAELFFTDGSMTATGLRKERDRGRLATWKIAGKEYTTKFELEEMMKRCRVERKDRISGYGANGGSTARSLPKQLGSSLMMASISPRDALLAKIGQHKKN